MSKPIKLVVGKKYLFQNEFEVYFCGYNQFNIPVLETTNGYIACERNQFIPANWVSKGDNTYWHWKDMEVYLTNIKKEKNEKSDRKQTKRTETKKS